MKSHRRQSQPRYIQYSYCSEGNVLQSQTHASPSDLSRRKIVLREQLRVPTATLQPPKNPWGQEGHGGRWWHGCPGYPRPPCARPHSRCQQHRSLSPSGWGVRFYNKIMHIVNITRRAGEYCYRNTLHVEAGQAGTRTQCCCQEMELTERRVALGKIVFVFAFKSCESDAAH